MTAMGAVVEAVAFRGWFSFDGTGLAALLTAVTALITAVAALVRATRRDKTGRDKDTPA